MTSVNRCSTSLALGLSILALTGCGSSDKIDTGAKAEQSLLAMLDKAPGWDRTVRCVDAGDDRWECVAVAEHGNDKVSVSGTFSCDDRNCLWRPD